MQEPCVFCAIASWSEPASVVYEDQLTIAFIGLRQFHAGHTLVIPRHHFADVRDLDDATGAALMSTIVRITRAVGKAFGGDGMSLWHSIGPAAFQEVPHLHIHVHPRHPDDDFLRVYPGKIPDSLKADRDRYAEQLRRHL